MATAHQPLSAQISDARRLLALFTDPSHPHRRGRAAEIEKGRLALVAAIASQDADELHDATVEARYFLGFDCRACGMDLDLDMLDVGYCSRDCYRRDNWDEEGL